MKKIEISIENVIKDRLNLQSNQRILLNEFNIKNPAVIFNNINNVTESYKRWNEEKQKKFLITLGGKINFNKTKKFIESKLG